MNTLRRDRRGSSGGDEERGRRRAKADNVFHNSSLPVSGPMPTRSGSIPTLPSSRIAQLIKMEEPRRASLNSVSLKDGMECLANSRNDISFAKTEMEYLIARSRKAIEDYDGSSSACGGTGSAASGSSATTTPLGSPRASFNLKRWLHFQLETGKTRSKAKEDIRIAKRAMIAAEEVITQMEDSLVLEEASLDFRARELRRQSLETFKIMGDVKSLKSISDSQLAEKSNPCYENLGMSIESEFSSFTKDAGGPHQDSYFKEGKFAKSSSDDEPREKINQERNVDKEVEATRM